MSIRIWLDFMEADVIQNAANLAAQSGLPASDCARLAQLTVRLDKGAQKRREEAARSGSKRSILTFQISISDYDAHLLSDRLWKHAVTDLPEGERHRSLLLYERIRTRLDRSRQHARQRRAQRRQSLNRIATQPTE